MGQSLFINFDTNDLKSSSVASASDLRNRRFTQFVAGDSLELDLFLVGTSGLLNIQDYAEVRLGLGQLDARPDSGTYKIGSNTPLAYNHSAAQLEAIIDSDVADATVTQLTNFVFRVQFNSTGSQTIPSIDSRLLAPTSTVSVTKLVTGDASTKETWLWRLYQNPVAFTSSFSNITGQGVRGILSLATSGVYDLLGTNKELTTNLELELTDASGNVRTIMQAEVKLRGEVIGHNFTGSIPVSPSIPPSATTFLESFPDPTVVGDLTVGGLDLPTGAADGYVLTSDATGTASWQANAAANNKGFFATSAALTTAYPTGQNGWYAIVGTTDTFWVWDTDTTAWKDTDSNSLGTVTSVGITNGTGITSSGSPVTSSGSITVGLDTATQATLADVAGKANIASPTFTGDVTVPRLITNEIQSVGTTTGTAQPITYDSKEHRFRDYDETPSNLMVIKKADGVPIGKVGINQNNPVSALHVVGGHTSGGGIPNEALRVVGSGLFTSTDQTALVVAGDTDDDTAFAGTLLKLKRDAGTGETVDEINTGYVGSNGGGIYGGSSGNAAFIQVINGRKLEIATGATSVRRLQVSDTGVDITGNIVSSGYTQFGSLTTGARNALTASNGMVIYNSSLNKFQGYENGAWVNLV
tara:strand:- start:1484 stop:3406 length:1923 start_codon:yes stop_codon:yes gene_type:complete